jgi:hypothetical protein
MLTASDYLQRALQAFRIANQLPTSDMAGEMIAIAGEYLALAERAANNERAAPRKRDLGSCLERADQSFLTAGGTRT